MKPLHSYIAIRVDKPEEQTASGLYLAAKEESRISKGEVVAVGTGRITTSGLLIPPSVKVGDRVHFRDNAIRKNDKWYTPNETAGVFFVDESDILAVEEENDAPAEPEKEPVDLGLTKVAFPINNN